MPIRQKPSEGVRQRKTKLTVIVENTGHFAENAKKLGIDLSKVDYGVLSHAHYDHGNGIPRFFHENQTAKFYLREKAAENCYKKLGFFMAYIGLPKHVTRDFADRIQYASGDYQLTEGVWLIPHKTPNLEQLHVGFEKEF